MRKKPEKNQQKDVEVFNFLWGNQQALPSENGLKKTPKKTLKKTLGENVEIFLSATASKYCLLPMAGRGGEESLGVSSQILYFGGGGLFSFYQMMTRFHIFCLNH